MPGREFPRKSCDREFRRPRASHQIRRQRRVRLSTDCALTQIDARRHLTCRQISGMGRRIWNRTVCRDFTDRVSACARRNSSYHISTVHEARRGTSRLGLALAVLQIAALSLAPLSGCCARMDRETRRHSAAVAHACCPASHGTGQCPMHRGRTSPCRMASSSHDGFALPVVHAAVIPAPIATGFEPASEPCVTVAGTAVPDSAAVPDSPPPRV